MGRASIIVASCTLVLLSGCGDKPQPAKVPAVEKLPQPTGVAPKEAVHRAPSKDIAVRFPYGANDEVTTLVYSDLSPLARPDVARTLAAGLTTFATAMGVDRPCMDAIVGGAKELLVAGGQRGWVAVVSIPNHTLETVCKPSPTTGEPDTIQGVTKSWLFLDSNRACATTPNWLACGYPELVKQALAAGGEPTVPVDLVDTQIVTIDDRDPIKDFKLTTDAFPDRLETRIEITYDNDEPARRLHEELAHAAEMAPVFVKALKATPDQQKLMEGIANRLVVSHRGPRASLRIDLNGNQTEQASDIGTFASIMGAQLLKDRTEARKEVARANVRAIADKLSKAWDEKNPKGPFAKHDKLISTPPVPKAVPKGERVKTSIEGWKGWEAIGWTLTTPDFFQYEIKAAKDNQSADIVAHGDLNGDWKASSFTLHVSIDPSSKQLMVSPKVEETDPDE